jgi:hypothetical protein
MCKLRREKFESETLVKTRALTLASMQEFLQKRQEDDDRLRDEIDEHVAELGR